MSDPAMTHPEGEGSTLLFLVYLEIWYLASEATGIRGHLWFGLKSFMHTNVGFPFAATLMLGRMAGALFTCTAECWVPALRPGPFLCYLLTALSSWDQPCSFSCLQSSVFEGMRQEFSSVIHGSFAACPVFVHSCSRTSPHEYELKIFSPGSRPKGYRSVKQISILDLP